MPDGLRNFAKTDEALRLRKNVEYFVDSNIGEKTFIKETSDFTYKGPKLDKETKSRIEYVCKVENPENLENIIEVLGFKKILEVNKNRKLFKLNYKNKQFEILIDQIQHLEGYYSEFEIMIHSKDDMEEAKESIFNLMKEFGYKKSDSITISYLELVIKKINKIKN